MEGGGFGIREDGRGVFFFYGRVEGGGGQKGTVLRPTILVSFVRTSDARAPLRVVALARDASRLSDERVRVEAREPRLPIPWIRGKVRGTTTRARRARPVESRVFALGKTLSSSRERKDRE